MPLFEGEGLFMDFKFVVASFAMLLLVAPVFAGQWFEVFVPNQVVTVTPGEVGVFEVNLQSHLSQDVFVSVDSEVGFSISENNFTLGLEDEKVFYVFGISNNLDPGLYLLNLNIRGKKGVESVPLALRVVESRPVLSFYSEFSRVSAGPGGVVDFGFVVKNEGTEKVKNIVVKSDIPERMGVELPAAFELAGGETRRVQIRISVPKDYPQGEYEYAVTVGFGNREYAEKVVLEVVKKDTPAVGFALLEKWLPYKENDQTVGYVIFFRVENKEGRDLKGLQVKFANPPLDWKFDEPTFDLGSFETKEINVFVTPKDFEEHNVKAVLSKDFQSLGEVTISFEGSRVGVSTGMFSANAGSVIMGLLMIVIVVLVVLFVREKNSHADQLDEIHAKDYLKGLVEKTREGFAGTREETKPRSSFEPWEKFEKTKLVKPEELFDIDEEREEPALESADVLHEKLGPALLEEKPFKQSAGAEKRLKKKIKKLRKKIKKLKAKK